MRNPPLCFVVALAVLFLRVCALVPHGDGQGKKNGATQHQKWQALRHTGADGELHSPYRGDHCQRRPSCPCLPVHPSTSNIQFVALTSNKTQYRTASNCWPVMVKHMTYLSDVPLPNLPGERNLAVPGEIYKRLLVGLHKLHHQLEPTIQWVVVVDDDTYVFVDNAVRLLSLYNARKEWYIGALSEAKGATKAFGRMGYGGAGIFLSRPFLERMEPKLLACARPRFIPGLPREPAIVHQCSDKRLHWCVKGVVPLSVERGLHQVDLHGDIRGFLEGEVSRSRVVTLHHFELLQLAPGVQHNFAWLHAVATCSGDQRALFRRVVWPLAQLRVWVDLTYGYSLKLWPMLQQQAQSPVPHPHVSEITFTNRMGMAETWNFEFPVRRPDPPCRRLLMHRVYPRDAGHHEYARLRATPKQSPLNQQPVCAACPGLCTSLQRGFERVPRRVVLRLGSCPDRAPICNPEIVAAGTSEPQPIQHDHGGGKGVGASGDGAATTLALTVDLAKVRAVGASRRHLRRGDKRNATYANEQA